MDAIGTLAMFNPSDLSRLQFSSARATTIVSFYTIPASKFIILFSPWGSIGINASGFALCASIIICIGANGSYNFSNISVGLNLISSTSFSLNSNTIIDISYANCPI